MSKPLRLFDALWCQCRYETGRSAKGDMLVCGAAAVPGRSYCAEHVAIIYVPGTARTPRLKDPAVRAARSVADTEKDLTEILS